MSNQRNPTATSSIKKIRGSTLSLTSLSDSEDRSAMGKMREKRKRENSDLESVMDKMVAMFEEWQVRQEEKFTAFKDIMTEFKDNCTQFKASFEFVYQQYTELKDRCDAIQREKAELAARAQALEQQVERLQAGALAARVEMRNVPVFGREETKDFFVELFMKAGKLFEFDLSPCDIRNVYRAKARPGSIGPIMAEFTSILKKEKFIMAAKLYNKKHTENRLNTSNFKLKCPTTAVYVSEVLTPGVKKLLHSSREVAKSHRFSYCWVTHGRIYLRERDNSPAIRITNQKDLENLVLNK